MPEIGQVSRRDKEGKRGRNRIIWAACPDCGAERWVPIKKPQSLCRSCSGKRAIRRPEFRNAKHRPDCQCRRCIITRGELRGAANPSWKGGRTTHSCGYIYIHVSDDDPMRSMAGRDSIVFEHRLVMARHLERPLGKNETVHHINGDRADNRIENLELWIVGHPIGIRAEEYCAQLKKLKEIQNEYGNHQVQC